MDKIESLENLLTLATTIPEKIDALNALAWELRFDDVLGAKSISESAYELAKSLNNTEHPYPKGLAESLRNLGHCHERLSNFEAEISLLTEALSIYEALADLSGQATVLYLLGSAYWSLGDYYNALEHTLKSVEFNQEIGDRFSLAKAWNIVGLVYQSIGDLTESLEYFLRSLQLYQELGDKRGQGDTLSNSCEATFELGDYKNALTFGLMSLQIHEEINYKEDIGIVLTAVGRTYLALQQPQQALDSLHRGLNISRENTSRYSELRCLLYLGEAYQQHGDSESALSFINQALPLAQEIETKQELYECYRILADIYRQEANFGQALAAYEQFHTLRENVLQEIVKHKLDIVALIHRLKANWREAEIQHLKNIQLEREITERQKAQTALLESERKYRELVEHANSIILRIDCQGRISYFNEFAQKFFDYSTAQIVGQPVVGTIVPQRDSKGRDLGGLIREIGEHPDNYIHNENENMRRNGERVWVAWTNKAIVDEAGNVVEILCIGTDMTARKQAEEALRASEDHLRHIFAALSDHIYVTEYTIGGQRLNRYLSPIEALTGYPLEKLMADWSFWPSTLIHPDDRAKAASQAQRFAQGESSEMEYRLIRADGRVIWVRDSGRVERDPNSQSLFVYGLVSDITTRKQTEEALRQSEAKNRAILNAIPDLMFRLDGEGRFIDFSAHDVAEWYVKPEIFMGRTVSETLPPELSEATLHHIQRTFETNTTQIYEYQLDAPGVGPQDYEARMVISGDNEVLIIVRDITQRKQAEEALAKRTVELEETLNLLNEVIENLPVMLFMKDAQDLRFVRFNRAAENLVGLKYEEVIGKNDFDFFPKDQADFFVAKDREVLDNGALVDIVEEPIQTPQQGLRWLYTRKAPILGAAGQPKYLLGISVDITERKLAEEALRQARDELAARVEELETLNFVIRTITTTPELETALTIVPKTMVQLFKAQRSGVALLNTAGTELKVVAEFCRNSDMQSTVGRVIPVQDNISSSQVLQTGQGMVIPHAHVNPLTAPLHTLLRRLDTDSLMIVPLLVKGRAIGTIGVDRARGEPEFTAAEIKLAQTIAGQIAGTIEVTRLLTEEQRLRQSAEEASEFKSQLLARVSHELRTPLGSILGYSELLHEEVFGPVTTDQKQAAMEIMESTYYLTSLVNELLDQAQYERGNIELHLAPVSLENLVSQVQSRMSILARRKKLSLTFEIAPDLPRVVSGDQKRLQQILINLVSNAIKFTKAGQVNVRLFKASPTDWAMEVADTGLGISPEAQHFIFEPFRQADGSITRAHGGTGLGLAIVKQIATLMGGQIILESEIGKGSTFRVILPLNPVWEQTHNESSGLNH